MKKFFFVLTLLLFAIMALIGCGNSKKAATNNAGSEKEKFKVAFIYAGPAGDAGWTYAHDQGRKYLEKELPNVTTRYVESVPENMLDAERTIEQLVQEGNKVIFATSFVFMDAVIKVAKKHPDVVFMHCSGFKTENNAGTYFGRDYQARYLAGIVAGKSSKTGSLGYVAAMPIPEVIRGINAYSLGARSVNPKAKVKVVWTNTWFNPAKEKEAGKSLVEQDVDIIAQHQDSPGSVQAAADAGKLALGYNSDMRGFAPNTVLTGPVWNWGPYYVKVVESVMDKTWTNEQYWGSIKDGIIDLGPYGSMVTKDVKDLVAAKRQEIIDSKLEVFSGPLTDNTGVEKVPAGKSMSDKDMLEFNWFVEGVEGTIPKK